MYPAAILAGPDFFIKFLGINKITFAFIEAGIKWAVAECTVFKALMAWVIGAGAVYSFNFHIYPRYIFLRFR